MFTKISRATRYGLIFIKQVNGMEAKINIAAILKDKPQGTKLYDELYNVDVELDTISTTDTETVVWCTNETDNNTTCHRGYSEFGTVRKCTDGLQILFPSKEMRDWSKFAWKKGDVLVKKAKTIFIIFEGFEDDNYKTFKGKHCLTKIGNETEYTNKVSNILVSLFDKAKEDDAQTNIVTIGVKLGGKLNRETLEIEKTLPKFKDGDILVCENNNTNTTFIFSGYDKNYAYKYHVAFGLWGDVYISTGNSWCSRFSEVRYATEEEKQQFFDALAEEGKAWDAEKKQIVDLKPKVEFKPFDRVLVRDCLDEMWRPSFFAYYLPFGREPYQVIGGEWVKLCIPYEGNESLLGTTKDVKG